jgi:hypothetical protein
MTPSDEEIYRRQKAGLLWLVAYLATTALIVWAVYWLRARAMESLSTPEARAEWEQWRQAAAEPPAPGGVARKAPTSPEPPGLVLMRDHFGVMLAAAIVSGSVLFGVLMIFIRGAVSSRRPPPE